jgi:hypothetical protein
MNWNLFSRLREPSTWLAFGGVAGAFGLSVDESTWEQIGLGIGAICTVVAAFTKDPGSKT